MIFQPIALRIRNQQTIELDFNSSLSLFITKDNITITSTFSGVKDLEVLSIEISSSTLTIITRPQFANNLYLIHLLDTSTQAFEDINGVELSTANDDRNIYFIGTEDINNVRDTMLFNLPSNYNTEKQTLIHDTFSVVANEFNTAATTLQEIKNDNFISITVNDELYTRGITPTDRLKNEGAYEILRVSRNLTGTVATGRFSFDPTTNPDILFVPINLRSIQLTETIPSDDSVSTFEEFLITLSKNHITKLLSVSLNGGEATYDPVKFGYGINNGLYDKFAITIVSLETNQILLSFLTNGEFPAPVQGDSLEVVYEYDNTGRKIDKNSISVYSILEQKNERVPSNVSNFYLEFDNIVDENGVALSLGGVFFSKSSYDLSKHPAFLREITFDLEALPSAAGEYTINYITGQVFVFGTINTIGSGLEPPVASYFYKNFAVLNSDYFTNDDGYLIKMNPFSEFASQLFFISFAYEDTFIAGIDFEISSHVEVLNERVNNKLISDFGITAVNSPVKDVYQILNETTGEEYTPGLITGNKIFFNGNNPPKTSATNGEAAAVGNSNSERLAVDVPGTSPNGLLRIFPITLDQNPILNSRKDGIGANFNTSIQFTRTELFINEFYFNSFETIEQNIDKLREIGDYLVDYQNGKIYLAVSSSQDFDVGHISYSYGAFIPQHTHILDVNNITLGTTSANTIQDFEVGFIDDGIIVPKQLNYGYDNFDGQTRVQNSEIIFVGQLQDDFTVYTKYPISKVSAVYTQNDVDGYSAAILLTKNLFDLSTNSFTNNTIDLKKYVVLSVEANVDPDYYSVIIPDDTNAVKSVFAIENNLELLSTQLFLLNEANILITSITPIPPINPTSADVELFEPISFDNPLLNSLVDANGNRFDILSNPSSNIINVAITDELPITNIGSEILDRNGIAIAENLVILSVVEIPNGLFSLQYKTLPSGILIGYQVRDTNANTFIITEVDNNFIVVRGTSFTPSIDLVARIDTQGILVDAGINLTELLIPTDTSITLGENIRVGYITTAVNNLIVDASILSAGGVGLVIDYSIGQYFIDYTHLDDELLVSYEWGDNQLDWSISDTLSENDIYYVSYKYGASRSGLELNFAPLTNVSFLQNAPLSLGRETYRTAISAAMVNFLKGPTYDSIRDIAHAFTQIDPDIREAILNQWILGRDPLSLLPPKAKNIIFGKGKFGDGLLIENDNSIQLPGESSIRLTQGTFSTRFAPNWHGNQADEFITFTLPTMPISVYYNAHNVLPTDVPENQWKLDINADAYGSYFVNTDYLEIRNAKNEFTTSDIPTSPDDGYFFMDGYVDGYVFSSNLMLHDPLTGFPYERRIGKYFYTRNEPTLNIINDFTINFFGYMKEITYMDVADEIVDFANIEIDDGYSKYTSGFYLTRGNLYNKKIALIDVHLDLTPPLPKHSPPIFVSTTEGSIVVNVITGDTSTLSVNQQIKIGTAFPELTNILGFTFDTIVMRFPAQTTLTNVLIEELDPTSHDGILDGYGETYLRDALGTRDHITELRTNGWERQLLLKLQLIPFSISYVIIPGANNAPLSPETPEIDFLEPVDAGLNVVVDEDGNVFEIDRVEAPYVWLKIPTASGVYEPVGDVRTYRKVVGIKFPDDTLVSVAANWSISTAYTLTKESGILSLNVNSSSITESLVSHYVNNTSGDSKISFGLFDLDTDATARIHGLNYNIYSVLTRNDIYIGNVANNPEEDIISFKYDISSTGIPSLNTDKYFAIFTNTDSADDDDEPTDEIFVKMKIPSSWTLTDGTNQQTFTIVPIIKFSSATTGEIIDIVDGYDLSYIIKSDTIEYTAIDGYTYVPGNNNILLDGGPELRIAAGKRHYLLDVITEEGAIKLYRSGAGFLVAEIQQYIGNDTLVFNIRHDISSWIAGQYHHIATSWKINSYDKLDELHLFVDGDEVPNEIRYNDNILYKKFGQVYEESLTIVPRVASVDGYIVNDSNGSGLFILDTAAVQPEEDWINKTIVLNATIPGPNIFLNEPLIVSSIVPVFGGTMLFLSQNGQQLDFSIYGTSVPVLYGLATSATAIETILTRTNFGIFVNGIELNSPGSSNPQFRQVGTSQIVEIFGINSETGQYEEIVSITDTITIKTYGLLFQQINDKIFQYGSTVRNEPIVLDTIAEGAINSIDIPIEDNVITAFITDLAEVIEPAEVEITKILLPRIMI